MSEIRVTSVVGENGSDPVGLSTGFTVGSTSGTTATITHEGQASFTGIVTATSFVPTVGQFSHRNIIVNGAMQVAQRATTYTGADVFTTVDRFRLNHTGLNEDCTTAQADVASGTTPYTLGFRKAFKITNGNQSAGAGAGDRIAIQYRIEAQDVANSGWNYVSSSSNITLQFWVKSSVAQNFYGRLYTSDGTSQNYPFETGSLSADTWTKITKTIPGNSNLTFDNDNGRGLDVEFTLFRGTNETGSVTLNQWAAFNSGTYTPDNTSTWYTTNDATLEITGVQLEVGPVATPFEHRSFGDELARCQRYFYRLSYDQAANRNIQTGFFYNTTNIMLGSVSHPVEMRAAPTLTGNISGTNYWIAFFNSSNQMFDTIALAQAGTRNANFYFTAGSGFTTNRPCHVVNKNSPASCHFTAEL